jgi:hypothetical protein
VFDKLDSAEAASVLRELMDRHGELRSETEAIAMDRLSAILPLSGADDVEDAVLQFDYHDLNSRAGSHSWGMPNRPRLLRNFWRKPVEPFVDSMKRYLEMGLEDQARQFCQGILLGLYRVRGGDNDILNWAPDFPGEAAGHALEIWTKTDGTEGAGAPADKRRRRLSTDFEQQHMPDWSWVLNSRV